VPVKIQSSLKNTFIVANTYGYVDPFVANETPGGMMRFDYDETKG
jgi:hypothetical protein